MLAISEDNKMASKKLSPSKLYKSAAAATAAATAAGITASVISLKRGFILDLESSAVVTKRLGLTPAGRVWLAKNDSTAAAVAYLAAVDQIEKLAAADKSAAATAASAAKKRAQWRADYNSRIRSGEYSPKSKSQK